MYYKLSDVQWQDVPTPTRNSEWAKLKRDFPHVTPSYLSIEFGLDMRLPKLSTVSQLQEVYRVLQVRKLNGLLLKSI